MFDFLLQGFLIGLLASMPVGPIAVLCIQRTLYKGRWHGFATALGAAASDLIYALIASFGLSIIISFITSKQNIIQIIGCVVIIFFGIYLFRSRQTKTIPRTNSSTQNYIQDFATSFLMTLSNPMIIFLFIGLYAKFNFIHEGITIFKTTLGVLFVFLGAVSWWFLLVSFVNLFRSWINVRGLGIINKIMGVVLVIFGVAAFIASLFGETII